MDAESRIRRYRRAYAALLHLYPRPFRDRFGAGMAQTFDDLLRERAAAGRAISALIPWLFLETLAAALTERARQTSMSQKLYSLLPGSRQPYRTAMGIAIAAALLLFWINGAVGMIGSENQPANLLYGGVFIAILIGSAMARLRPRGMARAAFVTAAVQFLVPVAALIIWQPGWGGAGMIGVFLLNGIFVALWAWSGSLFLRAEGSAVPVS